MECHHDDALSSYAWCLGRCRLLGFSLLIIAILLVEPYLQCKRNLSDCLSRGILSPWPRSSASPQQTLLQSPLPEEAPGLVPDLCSCRLSSRTMLSLTLLLPDPTPHSSVLHHHPQEIRNHPLLRWSKSHSRDRPEARHQAIQLIA